MPITVTKLQFAIHVWTIQGKSLSCAPATCFFLCLAVSTVGPSSQNICTCDVFCFVLSSEHNRIYSSRNLCTLSPYLCDGSGRDTFFATPLYAFSVCHFLCTFSVVHSFLFVGLLAKSVWCRTKTSHRRCRQAAHVSGQSTPWCRSASALRRLLPPMLRLRCPPKLRLLRPPKLPRR